MEATRILEEVPAPVSTASADRCPNCSAAMAPDQRYCIACGERVAGGGVREAFPRPQPVADVVPARRRMVWPQSSSAGLIAGVATLLLAMGVGVLIGHSGRTTATPAASRQPIQVVTVGGGSAGSARTSAPAASTSAGATAQTARHHKGKAAKASHATHVAGTSDVQKVAAQNHVKLPPKVVKVGGKCPAGAKGCQGGKFTGNFFGGG